MFSQRHMLAVVVIASLLWACDQSTGPNQDEGDSNRIIGSGILATDTFSVGSFHGVKARGVARVVITPGPDETVIITADDNILPLLRAQVEDGVPAVGAPDDGALNIRTENEILIEYE